MTAEDDGGGEKSGWACGKLHVTMRSGRYGQEIKKTKTKLDWSDRGEAEEKEGLRKER